MPTKSLAGKTALVTGAVHRLGRAIAVRLAEAGANIVVHHSGRTPLPDDLAAQFDRLGVKWWQVKADFETPAQYEALMEQALKAAGSLDLLVNSAAVFPASTLKGVRFEEMVRSLQINAWVPLVLSRDFARLAGRGNIINVLDTRVDGYDWNHVAYILSKHALAVLTKMTALEFAPQIRVNAVAPGLILPPPGKDEAYLDRLAATVPLKRHGGPADVAEAVHYLATAPYVTGETLHIDGGRHLWEYGDGPHPDQ
jgi:NAD(P)-dependent dehydrogenase (short-subunit alcohol dehydrogenase family)